MQHQHASILIFNENSAITYFFLFQASFSECFAADFSRLENVVIDDESQVFTIQEKNGRISSVKSELETTYSALRSDGYADAIAMYNDNISIDKASAPGAKPYYRSWESQDVFYNGARVCYLRVPVAKGKKTKAVFNQL